MTMPMVFLAQLHVSKSALIGLPNPFDPCTFSLHNPSTDLQSLRPLAHACSPQRRHQPDSHRPDRPAEDDSPDARRGKRPVVAARLAADARRG